MNTLIFFATGLCLGIALGAAYDLHLQGNLTGAAWAITAAVWIGVSLVDQWQERHG